jgi:hypothetical protein
MAPKHHGPPLGWRAGVVQELSFSGDNPLPKTPQQIATDHGSDIWRRGEAAEQSRHEREAVAQIIKTSNFSLSRSPSAAGATVLAWRQNELVKH